MLHPEITGVSGYHHDDGEDKKMTTNEGDPGEAKEITSEYCSETSKCKSILLNPHDISVNRRKISGSLSSDQIDKQMMYLDQVILTPGTRSVSPKMIFASKHSKSFGHKSSSSSSIGETAAAAASTTISTIAAAASSTMACFSRSSGSVDQTCSKHPDLIVPTSSDKTRKPSMANVVLSGTGRIVRLLRRTHSAGCSKDVPSHALFLREKPLVSSTVHTISDSN